MSRKPPGFLFTLIGAFHILVLFAVPAAVGAQTLTIGDGASVVADCPGTDCTEAGAAKVCADGQSPAPDGFTGCWCDNASPTAVELVSFAASFNRNGVLLEWATASESDTAGFHLLRSDCTDDQYTTITPLLIPAAGGPTSGASYTHEDRDVASNRLYCYKLQEVDLQGGTTLHGPVQVMTASAGGWERAGIGWLRRGCGFGFPLTGRVGDSASSPFSGCSPLAETAKPLCRTWGIHLTLLLTHGSAPASPG